jgi:hypothetical protein
MTNPCQNIDAGCFFLTNFSAVCARRKSKKCLARLGKQAVFVLFL